MKTKTPALLVLAIVFPAATAAAQDKVYLKSGEVHEGTLTGLSYKEVSYDAAAAGGAPQTQAAAAVKSIEFDPNQKPPNFSYGEDLFKKGEFVDARAQFEKALKDSRAKDWYKQYARWYLILCQQEIEDWAGMVNACKALRQDFPDSFFLRDTFTLQYQAAQADGKVALQDEAVNDFQKAANDKKMTGAWQKNIDLLKAETAELKGDFKAAKALHDRYATRTEPDPDVSRDAKLGQLRCLAGMQDWSGLRTRAEELINEGKSGKAKDASRLLLGAYVARGKALLLGEKKSKEALLDFMRGVVDLSKKVAGSSREHEESLGWGAVASARLAAEQKDTEKRGTYRSRAGELKAELLREYRNSPLRAMVDKEIAAIPK